MSWKRLLKSGILLSLSVPQQTLVEKLLRMGGSEIKSSKELVSAFMHENMVSDHFYLLPPTDCVEIGSCCQSLRLQFSSPGIQMLPCLKITSRLLSHGASKEIGVVKKYGIRMRKCL